MTFLSENFIHLHFKIFCHEIASWNVASGAARACGST